MQPEQSSPQVPTQETQAEQNQAQPDSQTQLYIFLNNARNCNIRTDMTIPPEVLPHLPPAPRTSAAWPMQGNSLVFTPRASQHADNQYTVWPNPGWQQNWHQGFVQQQQQQPGPSFFSPQHHPQMVQTGSWWQAPQQAPPAAHAQPDAAYGTTSPVPPVPYQTGPVHPHPPAFRPAAAFPQPPPPISYFQPQPVVPPQPFVQPAAPFVPPAPTDVVPPWVRPLAPGERRRGVDGAPLPDEEYRRRRENGLCVYCGTCGHYARCCLLEWEKQRRRWVREGAEANAAAAPAAAATAATATDVVGADGEVTGEDSEVAGEDYEVVDREDAVSVQHRDSAVEIKDGVQGEEGEVAPGGQEHCETVEPAPEA